MFDENNSTIICIDIQDKLVNMLANRDEIILNTSKIMNASNILNINTIITEQYPKGLGNTIENICLINDFQTIEKTSFSVLKTPEFCNIFKEIKNKNNNNNVLIFGIETHICVLQSVNDLLEKGFNVYVISDCCASRTEYNHKIALELMKQKGANIITLEIALFEFLKSSNHPHFKEIQKLIK
jgi:nicotinamidase-related amidase